MALITCKNCGKRISDTVSNCIHCGAATKDIIVTPTVIRSYSTISPLKHSDTPTAALTDFNKLGEDKKVELENEFLKSDKRARAYVRKGVSANAYVSLASFLLPAWPILVFLRKWAIENWFQGKIYDQQWINYSYYFLFAIVILALVSVTLGFYSAFSRMGRVKKQLYYKKFQRWLLKKKSIQYTPNWVSKKDKQVFEQIDLNTMDL